MLLAAEGLGGANVRLTHKDVGSYRQGQGKPCPLLSDLLSNGRELLR